MKTLSTLVVALFFLSIAGCGGGNADAKAFCECWKTRDDKCEEPMEKLEDEFKKDPKRYEEFKKAAMEMCPDAERIINRMN